MKYQYHRKLKLRWLKIKMLSLGRTWKDRLSDWGLPCQTLQDEFHWSHRLDEDMQAGHGRGRATALAEKNANVALENRRRMENHVSIKIVNCNYKCMDRLAWIEQQLQSAWQQNKNNPGYKSISCVNWNRDNLYCLTLIPQIRGPVRKQILGLQYD